MISLDDIKKLRKTVIFQGKSQPKFAKLKKPTNEHMAEKYSNPNNIDESGSITEADVELLYELIKKFKPKTILEIGTWLGTSAMVMDLASEPGTTIYTCDKHDVCTYESFNVHKYIGMSTGFFDKMITDGVKADFVFLDGRLQGDEGKLLQCTTNSFIVFVHDYEKPKKGWKNIRALQKLFPDDAAIMRPSKDTALMIINRGDE